MSNTNSRGYFFIHSNEGDLYEELLDREFEPIDELPLFNLRDGFEGSVYVYEKTEQLKDAIAYLLVEHKLLWGWDEV